MSAAENKKSICILLTDPLKTFVKKGEVKKNYYNPSGLFDKVYYISFAAEDVDGSAARPLSAGAETRVYPVGTLTALNLFPRLLKVLRLIKSLRPSVIRAYDPSLRGLFAVMAGRLFKIPVVISLHAEMDSQRQHDKRFILKARKVLELTSIRWADAVVCVTDYVRTYALRYGARHAVTIYNGVDLDQFSGSHDDVPEPAGRDVILCVGRLDKQKYQECLIRAVAELDAELILVGSGSELGRLEALTRELRLEKRVSFVHSVPHGQIQYRYREAKIFAIATHYEGFCIPVIEAMAAGVPVVASRIPPIEEIVGNSALLAENNAEDFRRKMELLLKDEGLRRQLVRRGYERVSVFDIIKNEEQQKDVYEALLNKKGAKDASLV